MIEKYLEEMGLLSVIDDRGKKYISACIENSKIKLWEITCSVDLCLSEAVAFENELEEAKRRLQVYFEGVISRVREYNDTLETKSIWSSVDAEEASEKLRQYYTFTKNIDELESNKNRGDISPVEINEALERSVLVSEKIRLFQISLDVMKMRDPVFEAVAEKHFVGVETMENLVKNSLEIIDILTFNEHVLGRFLTELRQAVDDANKGAHMNIAKAKKCCLAFLSQFRTV